MVTPRIQFVVAFKLNRNVVLVCGSGLDQLAQELKGRIQHVSIPEGAPPDAPRAILVTKEVLISLSLARMDVHVSIPGHVSGDFRKALDYGLGMIQRIISTLMVPRLQYQWSGIVAVVQSPIDGSATGLVAATPIADRILNVPRRDRELANFSVTVGYREDDVYANYVIRGYETRKLTLPMSKLMPDILIDLEHSKISGAGIEIVFDVNNKPSSAKAGPYDDLVILAREAVKRYDDLPSHFGIEGMMK